MERLAQLDRPLQREVAVGRRTPRTQPLGLVGGLANPHAAGLDVVLPAFYAALLVPELRTGETRRPLVAALAGGAIAAALIPVAPPGVPILAAAAPALIGLKA